MIRVAGSALTSDLSALAGVRSVWVGSSNLPKIDAVRAAIAPYAREVRVEGVAVPSDVPEQPVGLEEIVRGARNRAEQATRAARRKGSACDLAVGIEDGLLDLCDLGVPGLGPVNIGCAAVTDGSRMSVGFSSAFPYPPQCTERAIRDRQPIGELFDSLWAQAKGEGAVVSSGRTLGNVGKLTLGVLPRSDYARHAVLCALVSFLHPDLYAESGALASLASSDSSESPASKGLA